MAFTFFRVHYFPSDRKAYYKCSPEFKTHRRCEILTLSPDFLCRVIQSARLKIGGCPASGESHFTAMRDKTGIVRIT